MSMDPNRRPSRASGGPMARPPRPAFPVVAVVVAIVAALLGFIILKSLDDDTTGVSTGSGDTSSETTLPSDSTETTDTTPTLPQVDRSQFKVLVANASGVQGSAGRMSDQLAALGYTMLTATNAKDTTTKLDSTVVYYVAGAEAAGQDVAVTLGRTALPMPTQLPVAVADFDTGSVIVMLGTDLSDQALPAGTATQTTVAAVTGSDAASPNG
ncbi:MAG: LytR C-terminal domain-containing protein [Ilumatobacteraceae bacterium]